MTVTIERINRKIQSAHGSLKVYKMHIKTKIPYTDKCRDREAENEYKKYKNKITSNVR